MNENIDLTQILKDCPEGWKFYSYVFGEETYFKGVSPCQGSPLPISIYGKYEGCRFHLSSKGHPYCDSYGECVLFPSKEQRDWSKFTAPWYKNKNEKFDPNTLNPFDKVLVRSEEVFNWNCSLFSNIDDFDSKYPFTCLGLCYKFCIPYNDDTKHLIGTTDEAPEFYKYWEN